MKKSTQKVLFQLVQLGLGIENKDIISDKVDWMLLFDVSEQQGVAGICVDGFQKALTLNLLNGEALNSLNSPRVEYRKLQWFGGVMQMEQEYNQRLRIFLELQAKWKEAGIDAAILKGMAFAQYWPKAEHRGSCDVDCFLMKPYQTADVSLIGRGSIMADKGDEIAEEQGAKVDRSEQKHSHIYYKGLHVENHHTCCGQLTDPKIAELESFLEKLLNDPGNGTIEGTTIVKTPLLFDALFCLYHARVHLIVEEGIQLKHLVDWFLISKRVKEEFTEQFFSEYVETFGLTKFYNSIEHVSQYAFGSYEYEKLNEAELFMLEDIFYHESSAEINKGSLFSRRLKYLQSIWRNRKKYPLYTDSSAMQMMWWYVKGYVKRWG